VPLFLADGRAALAWTDNTGSFLPQHAGRLHLAVEGVPPPADPPAPALRVRAAATQRVFASQAPVIDVRCAAACDVRAALGSRDAGPNTVTRTLAGGRVAQLQLAAPALEIHRRVRARVVVTATAPNGHHRVTVSRRILLVRRPAPPVPAPLGVRARRQGRAIVVTWHTAAPARRTFFYVVGRRTRRATLGSTSASELVRGHGRTHFRVRLRTSEPEAIRWVSLAALSIDRDRAPKPVVVPVR
jgi:hypothetical protein